MYGEIPLAIVYESFEFRLNRLVLLTSCSKISPFRHMVHNTIHKLCSRFCLLTHRLLLKLRGGTASVSLSLARVICFTLALTTTMEIIPLKSRLRSGFQHLESPEKDLRQLLMYMPWIQIFHGKDLTHHYHLFLPYTTKVSLFYQFIALL